jgi:isopentenyl diphosphate isomerase/L-lactate dehydrogenase-like FMN-dependent dehydrogenase
MSLFSVRSLILKGTSEGEANEQEAAESILIPRTVDYYGAASLDAYTLAENKSSFRKCRLLPRVMRDVSSIRPQTTIFGCESALPIYVSPASNALLGHPEGELNITRGVSSSLLAPKALVSQVCERLMIRRLGLE